MKPSRDFSMQAHRPQACDAQRAGTMDEAPAKNKKEGQ